jgi:hypothetical protein
MVSPLWMVMSREKKSVYSKTRPFSGCWLAGSAWSTPTVTATAVRIHQRATCSAIENVARLPSATARDKALWNSMSTPR